jgi:hypothetical protein
MIQNGPFSGRHSAAPLRSSSFHVVSRFVVLQGGQDETTSFHETTKTTETT